MKHTITKQFFIVPFLLLCSVITYAHQGSTKGIVTDGTTHKPLEGINIYIKEVQQSAVTDQFGKYFLKGITPGLHTIIIAHVGYETVQEKVRIVDGETTELTTNMTPAAVNIQEVTINAKKDISHTALSAVDLKLRPVNSTQDMMRMVQGLFTSQHQGGGKAEQMFLRGFDVDHGTDVNVCVDGMPVNMVSHAHGQGYADLHFLIPEAVDKMDFGKGPYRADKGDFCTAGWVDFKTRDILDNSFVKMEAGMYGYYRTVAGVNLIDRNAGKNNQEAYILGEYGYNRSYFDAPQNFNRFNLMGKYTNYLAPNKMLSITLSGFRSTWDASGQVPQRAVDAGVIGRYGGIDPEGGSTSRYNMNIQFAQAINDHSSFKSNLYASCYTFDLYSNFTFYLVDTINGDQIHQKEPGRFLTGYNAVYTTNYNIGSLHTKTEVGGGFRYDNTMNIELSHTANKDTVIQRLAYGDINQTNLFGYANQTLYLTPRLVANAGVRFDYFIHDYNNKLTADAVRNTFNTAAFSPKAGLYYNFSNNARLFFNYGVGFHSNDTRVVIPLAAKDVLPLAYSYDLGVVIKPFKKLLLSTGLWMLDLQQEFAYVGDEATVEPSGRTRRMGIDFSARYELLKWLYIDGDFNYTRARYVDEKAGQDYVPLAARITSIGGVTFKVNKNITGSIRYRHMGDRPANEDNSVVAKGYTVVDAVVNYTNKHYEFGLQAQNLFNTTWDEAQFDTETRLRNEATSVSQICFTPGTPFFLKLSATYKF